MKFLSEEKNLKDQTVIFEQEMPEFKVNRQVQREMQLLKTLWDYVNVISTSLNEWKKTTWKKIDVEWMDQECKKLLRELRRENCYRYCFIFHTEMCSLISYKLNRKSIEISIPLFGSSSVKEAPV